MEYRLMRPDLQMEPNYLAYMAALEALGEPTIPWAAGLRGMSYTDWLRDIEKNRTTPDADKVPATLFAFVNSEGTLLGFLDLRHCLNENLMQTGGHIGYGLHPLQRGMGLAPKMLALGLEEAKNLGLEKVLVTCNKDNHPSAKTIRHCGGMLENEVTEEDGNLVQRYWINLSGATQASADSSCT